MSVAKRNAMTEAEVKMATVLASQVLTDRLERSRVIGATKSGRIIIRLVGEPTEAEQAWKRLEERLR